MCVCVYQSINADAVPLRMRSYVTSNCRECPGKFVTAGGNRNRSIKLAKSKALPPPGHGFVPFYRNGAAALSASAIYSSKLFDNLIEFDGRHKILRIRSSSFDERDINRNATDENISCVTNTRELT